MYYSTLSKQSTLNNNKSVWLLQRKITTSEGNGKPMIRILQNTFFVIFEKSLTFGAHVIQHMTTSVKSHIHT